MTKKQLEITRELCILFSWLCMLLSIGVLLVGLLPNRFAREIMAGAVMGVIAKRAAILLGLKNPVNFIKSRR
jgi:hypothetical protein